MDNPAITPPVLPSSKHFFYGNNRIILIILFLVIVLGIGMAIMLKDVIIKKSSTLSTPPISFKDGFIKKIYLEGQVAMVGSNFLIIKESSPEAQTTVKIQLENNTAIAILGRKEIASESATLKDVLVDDKVNIIADLFREKGQEKNIARSIIAMRFNTSSGGFRNVGDGLVGFNGKIIEKGDNYLKLEGGGQSVKVEISNNTEIQIIVISEFLKNPNSYTKQNNFPFSSIKENSRLDAVGKYDKKLLKAVLLTVTQ